MKEQTTISNAAKLSTICTVAWTMEPQSCNHYKNDEWFVFNRKALQRHSFSQEKVGRQTRSYKTPHNPLLMVLALSQNQAWVGSSLEKNCITLWYLVNIIWWWCKRQVSSCHCYHCIYRLFNGNVEKFGLFFFFSSFSKAIPDLFCAVILCYSESKILSSAAGSMFGICIDLCHVFLSSKTTGM